MIVLSASMFVATSAAAADITTGLVAHYDFDAVSGTAVPDVSGNLLDGTLTGAPVVGVGQSGNGVNFPTAADYMNLPAGIVSTLTSFTISEWVNITTLNTWSRIFDFGTGTSYYMFLCPRASSATGPVRFAFKNGGAEQVINGKSSLPTGKWVHVAVTLSWDAATSKGVGNLYVNGNLVGTNAAMTINPSMLPSTTQNYVAKSQYPDPALAGLVDDLRIYNRALSTSDVLVLAGLPVGLITEYDNLTAATLKVGGDLANVTGNLTIPSTLSSQDVSISWASTLPSNLAIDGTVIQPDKYDASVKLTATLTQVSNGVTYTLVKDFFVTVKAKTIGSEVVAKWTFDSGSLSTTNGVSSVKDGSESGFVGTLMNDSRIRTIGGATNGLVNVLDLGNGKGYFDMGIEIGKAIYSLKDYTMCTFFRIDDTNTDLNSNGNFVWNFSNSDNAPVDMNGYIIGSLKNQANNCSSGYWAVGDQGVGLNKNASKGGWHHFAFTQSGSTGTIYVDGVQVAQNVAMSNVPSVALLVPGRTGTLYNWLGRSCYPGDVYLKNTLLYDFQLLSIPLSSTDLTSYIAIGDSIAKLDAQYIENSDVLIPELTTETDALVLGDLSAVTANIVLPTKGSIDPSISIAWSSNNESIISTTGVVNQPNYFDKQVTLTATLAKNGQKKNKTFDVKVLALASSKFTSDLLVKYDFSTVSEDSVITDAAEKHFTGVVRKSARVQSMGTTNKFNIVNLGDSIGYFDMGTEIGKVLYGLSDYTMSAFYRIDETYTDLAKNGNFLWNFSNSANVAVDKNGYIIGALGNQSVSVSPGFYTAASGNQTVSFATAALAGGWHNLTYTQSSQTGTVYVDGTPVALGAVTNLPIIALPKPGLSGTPYNWLGRSCYSTDSYLRKTLVYGFQLYKIALTDEQVQTSVLNVLNTIDQLNNAYAEGFNGVGLVKSTAYKAVATATGIKVYGLTGSEKISVVDIMGRQIIKRSSLSEFTVKKGIYLVKVNEYAFKVLVK